jgi:hypothetical protein
MWKRRLSIFLSLAILAVSIQWEPTPVKSAAPVQIFLPYIRNTVPVVISESKCTRTKYWGPAVRGNVLNTSDRPVYDVTILADFYDYDGQWVISNTWQTAFTPTVSMQRNPFEVDSLILGLTVADCKARIISWSWESPAEFLPLTVVYSDTTDSPEGAYAEVLFRNDNSVSLKNVITYAWSLDQYYSFYTPSLQDPIAPGETITYTKGIMDGHLPVYVLGMGSVDP